MKHTKTILAVALVMAMAALPCFAEIRVDRGGYSEYRCRANYETYWNDKYVNHNVGIAKEDAKKMVSRFRGKLGYGVSLSITEKNYYGSDSIYSVMLFVYDSSLENCRKISVTRFYAGGYSEELYENDFFSYNDAKAKFDSLCQQYYNKIPK